MLPRAIHFLTSLSLHGSTMRLIPLLMTLAMAAARQSVGATREELERSEVSSKVGKSTRLPGLVSHGLF